MSAAAQYAESAAEVSPVDAQPTPTMGMPRLRMWLTCETSAVMPRSLNEPVCEGRDEERRQDRRRHCG